MSKLHLPLYTPTFAAPERGALTLLAAALQVTQRVLRTEHPLLDRAPRLDQHHAPLVIAAAKLIVDRCADLQTLLDFYDAAVDEATQPDEDIPF